jgi:hypothetical protein
VRVDGDLEGAQQPLTQSTGGKRLIMFAATLGNTAGEMDGFRAIGRHSRALPLFLHVDASHTFDYITTLSTPAQKRLGLPQLKLRHPHLDAP